MNDPTYNAGKTAGLDHATAVALSEIVRSTAFRAGLSPEQDRAACEAFNGQTWAEPAPYVGLLSYGPHKA
jgi:hypothetical protein